MRCAVRFSWSITPSIGQGGNRRNTDTSWEHFFRTISASLHPNITDQSGIDYIYTNVEKNDAITNHFPLLPHVIYLVICSLYLSAVLNGTLIKATV